MPTRKSFAQLALVLFFCVAEARAAQTLLEINPNFDPAALETRDVIAKLSPSGTTLRIDAGHKVDWPGVTIKAPAGRWNLSPFQCLVFDVQNVGKKAVTVHCRVDNPGADGTKNCFTQSLAISPGKKSTFYVPLPRPMPDSFKSKLFGMRGFPGCMLAEDGIDPANVTKLIIFLHKPAEDHSFEISSIRAEGKVEKLPPLDGDNGGKTFFPLIDEFGQYIHRDWPGKIHSAADFSARKDAEAADLAANPGNPSWNQYGGWKNGPQLPATGFFRTEKHDGKWWLVDPEGRLFWSHGIDCVNFGSATTPITDRKHWFTNLPQPGSPLAHFYGRGNWAPHNYYDGKQYETFNFTAANIRQKYGDKWEQPVRELTHRRLRSWGINTIGNWSDGSICRMHKTPYTATIGIHSKPIGGSSGYWRKFADVFAPEFQKTARRNMATHKNGAAGDPWCIGFFIDNEESWGDELSLATATLASPSDQPAKIEFLADLRKKYETIERLNAAWDAKYASWDALLNSTDPPKAEKARPDLMAFYTKTAEQYFKICRDAVKEVAPNQLYLGCRFAWANDLAIRAAAKYCDVVSFNRYQRSLTAEKLSADFDKPAIIGEFHFGALDRGMFHTGLVYTASQSDRAKAYKTYVQSALENPVVVGTHWFQFGDQATTGRGDGENYQIGFLDACDTPYAETIQAVREISQNMYEYRSK